MFRVTLYELAFFAFSQREWIRNTQSLRNGAGRAYAQSYVLLENLVCANAFLVKGRASVGLECAPETEKL